MTAADLLRGAAIGLAAGALGIAITGDLIGAGAIMVCASLCAFASMISR